MASPGQVESIELGGTASGKGKNKPRSRNPRIVVVGAARHDSQDGLLPGAAERGQESTPPGAHASDSEPESSSEEGRPRPLRIPRASNQNSALESDHDSSPGARRRKKSNVARGVRDNLIGGDTWPWTRICDKRIMSSSQLRQRLLDMWTLLGVITALVASFAVDGIANSASSFSSFEQFQKNDTLFCAGSRCISANSLYQVYGLITSLGFLLSVLSLATAILFYSYLLIHPVDKTRWFVHKNVHLFPTVFFMVIASMALVAAGVCVQCLAAFNSSIGYTVIGAGSLFSLFFLWMILRLESQTRTGLESYLEEVDGRAASNVTA